MHDGQGVHLLLIEVQIRDGDAAHVLLERRVVKVGEHKVGEHRAKGLAAHQEGAHHALNLCALLCTA
jgi:hypothetical protein